MYLELDACRLTNLPANFSSLIPNVRALNLNYNFLETEEVAQGLVGLSRLRKLTLVGNRMSGTKALVKMLSSMGKNIEMIDFRYVKTFSLNTFLTLEEGNHKRVQCP